MLPRYLLPDMVLLLADGLVRRPMPPRLSGLTDCATVDVSSMHAITTTTTNHSNGRRLSKCAPHPPPTQIVSYFFVDRYKFPLL